MRLNSGPDGVGVESLRRRLGWGIFLGVLGWSSLAGADRLEGRGLWLNPEAWDYGLYAPSPHVSQYDNPRYTGHVWLEGNESVERSSLDVQHRFNKVRFVTECPTGDLLCVGGSVHAVRPTQDGVWRGGVYAELQAYGARIGHRGATWAFEKENRFYEATRHDQFDVRVDRETIIVPVHVVVEVPRDDVLPMARLIDPLLYQALFDDDFADPYATVTVSHPGEGFDQHWTASSQESNRTTMDRREYMPLGIVSLAGLFDEVRPDDLWVQCGIQFRLASVTLLSTTTATIQPFDGKTAPQMNQAVEGYAQRVRGGRGFEVDGDVVQVLWGDLSLSGVFVALIPWVGGGGTVDANLGRAFGNVAAVAVYPSRPTEVKGLIAHELGHVLGVTGTDENHPKCESEHDQQLMCRNGGHVYHMGGCDRWRHGAERRAVFDGCLEEPCHEPTIDLPITCSTAELEDALPVCARAREGAADWAKALSGNQDPVVDLVDRDGVSLDRLPSVPGDYGKSVECGDSLVVRRVVTSPPGDPYPEISLAMGGWTIGYGGVGDTYAEQRFYPATVESVTVDLKHRPGERIVLRYAGFDIQAAKAEKFVYITHRGDDEPPTIASLPAQRLEGCADGELRPLPTPTDAVEDNCGAVSLAGRIVARNGQPLATPSPLDLVAGTRFSEPGDYVIEWVATDEAGNVSAPTTQRLTVDACLGAGSSLQVQSAARLSSPNGSPLALLVARPGGAFIGGQAVTGSVTSAGDVRVDGGAIVAGDVLAGGDVFIQERAVVTGQVSARQALQLPAPPSLEGQFPASCGGAARYDAGTGEQELAPGCYEELRIGSRATVLLQPGEFFFHRVEVEPQAVLVTAQGVRFEVRDHLSFRGRLESPAGGEGWLALRYRGQGSVLVEAPFQGSVLAPAGKLILGGSAGQTFRGQFYGDEVEVRAGLEIVAQTDLPESFGPLASRARSGALEVPFPNVDRACAWLPGHPQKGGWVLVMLAGWLWIGNARRRSRS